MLPTWSVSDVHESFDSRSFVDAKERSGADVERLIGLFDAHHIRASAHRAATATATDGAAADAVIAEYNRVAADLDVLGAYVYASVSTDSRDAAAQAEMSELEPVESKLRPLLARLADWVGSFDLTDLVAVSAEAAEHLGPLSRLAERADHQMTEDEEHLYAELSTTGAGAWGRLQREITSQLSAIVDLPDGSETLPINAVRGLATDPDPVVRRAAFDAELLSWPSIEVPIAAAMNAIKGEANTVNRRRKWNSPLDASLFANSVSRTTFDAMHRAITASLPDFRRWMNAKAKLHGHSGPLPWWDLVAPAPVSSGAVSWDDGLDVVRTTFGDFSPTLGRLVDRAVDERWIDAAPRDGKSGGAFCMPFVDDRSLVLLNWSGSAESTQTTAHELGHAYHNTTLSERTPLQRRLPMALAETASIFCETLVVEAGLARLDGPEHAAERLALLDIDLQGSNQVVVDIRSRFTFETEIFARRQRRTLSAGELSEMMNDAQTDAYGSGLDQATAHPYMWLLKPHYYGSHFYNWPYTYGLLFGLGLFSRYREDPEHFRSGYDTLLSRAGMDTAEELGAAFGLDVTDEAFWTASLDVIRARIDSYVELAEQFAAVNTATTTRYDLTHEEFGRLLDGEPRYRLDQVWAGLYEQLAEPADITNLPKALRGRLDAELPLALELVTESVSDDGDTVKFLWQLDGGSRVETVLMLYPERATVCVSSQAGCAMACGFCATGQAGFTRHLTTGEIVEQVVRAAQTAKANGRRVSNIVFMGMGEPMANLDRVWAATERIHGDIGLSARHITISTVGILPGIRAMKDLPLPVNLAVSLHAANDELRNELVPINKRYPINDLIDACAEYLEVKNRRVSFEWAMIDGVNDRAIDAEQLAELCWKLRPSAHVNLIPLNPTPGYPTKGTPLKRVYEFRDRLEALGANATVRRNRGTDIDAACGQLAAGQAVTLTKKRS